MSGLSIDAIALDVLAWPSAEAATILVAVRSDAITGYAEVAAASGRLALLRRLAARALGRDALHVNGLRAAWAGQGPPAETAVLGGAIEAALLDLQARQAGLPLYRLFGGRHRERVALAGRVAEQGVRALTLGPASLVQAIRDERIDVWVADPIDAGGPDAFLRAAAVCRTFLVDIALDGRVRTEIGAHLALHLAAALRVINRAFEPAPALLRGEAVVAGGLAIENGFARVPETPGLGIAPDPVRLSSLGIERIQVDAAEAVA